MSGLPYEVDHSWNNPLSENAIAIASAKLSDLSLVETALSVQGIPQPNSIDGPCQLHSGDEQSRDRFPWNRYRKPYASTSDFSGMRVTNLHVGESIIAKLVIVGAHVENVT